MHLGQGQKYLPATHIHIHTHTFYTAVPSLLRLRSIKMTAIHQATIVSQCGIHNDIVLSNWFSQQKGIPTRQAAEWSAWGAWPEMASADTGLPPSRDIIAFKGWVHICEISHHQYFSPAERIACSKSWKAEMKECCPWTIRSEFGNTSAGRNLQRIQKEVETFFIRPTQFLNRNFAHPYFKSS